VREWLPILFLAGFFGVAALTSGCAPCPEEVYGYQCGAFDGYHVTPSLEHVTPGGISYQGELNPSTLDEYTDAVEACLGKSVDHSSFVVLVAPDWYQEPAVCTLPQWGPQQLLPVPAPEGGCLAKGYTPSDSCPCRWRAGVTGNTLVVTPNLLIYKDVLLRWTLQTDDPWTTELAPCSTP
jgi:hypothetical protein